MAKEKKQLKELSEEELKEVTGGGKMMDFGSMMMICKIDVTNPCPSLKYDSQCNCIQ